MQYPDYSQLWLSDAKDGRATTLAASSSPASETPVSVDTLSAEDALGKKVQLGTWNNKPLTWTVISANRNMGLLLCDSIVASMQLCENGTGDTTPSWLDSQIRKWLNLTFLSRAFDLCERSFISPAFGDTAPNPDKATLLNAEETATYVPHGFLDCQEGSWWLRCPSYSDKNTLPAYIDKSGALCADGSVLAFRGVRPVVTVRFFK